MMQEWANTAISTARLRGATYADARVMDIRHRDISVKNGEVGTLAESETLGIGIRVIADGAWGFASTDRLTREGVQACAGEAVAIAKASALAKRENVALAPEKAYVDTWQNPFIKDPFRIPVERQIDVLLAADKEMRRVKGVTRGRRLDGVSPYRAAFRIEHRLVDSPDQDAIGRGNRRHELCGHRNPEALVSE